MTVANARYLEMLTLYYEEEIEGAGWFNAMAEGMPDADKAAKMRLLADVESHAARAVEPLLKKYGLTPRDQGALIAEGVAQGKADARKGWDALIREMHETFPCYMVDFARLEAFAPHQDLPELKVLTAHEIAAIDFVDREIAGQPDSTEPLTHYLETGGVT